MSAARLVITDSGRIREEACILRIACVTVRDNTERPERGPNMIAGVKPDKGLSDSMYGVNLKSLFQVSLVHQVNSISEHSKQVYE
jgi:hypothetical protein